MHDAASLFIPSPAGQLEAGFTRGNDARAIVACHPHPQYGGSMHDAVVETVLGVARSQRFSTLKFNFRGVGASSGRYDNGIGEVDDLLAALAWLRDAVPTASIWIAGYSFGSNVAWRALERAGELAGVLLIAPPIALMEFAAPTRRDVPLHAIAGDADDYVDASQLSRWVDAAGSIATLDIIAGADHFFSGGHAGLGRAVDRALAISR